jgi:hypothetical protein
VDFGGDFRLLGGFGEELVETLVVPFVDFRLNDGFEALFGRANLFEAPPFDLLLELGLLGVNAFGRLVEGLKEGVVGFCKVGDTSQLGLHIGGEKNRVVSFANGFGVGRGQGEPLDTREEGPRFGARLENRACKFECVAQSFLVGRLA